MTNVGGAGSAVSPRQIQDGARATQSAGRSVTQATRQAETVSKMQRPQDTKAAATFDRNMKQAAKLAHEINVKSTRIGKQAATNVKALPKADQKLVTKDIGKNVAVVDKGGTGLEKKVAQVAKSSSAPAKGKAKGSPADDKKAVAASADLMKKLLALKAELDAVEKDVVSKLVAKK